MDSWCISLCVLVVPPVVLVVPIFSDVNVDVVCEVFLSDSDYAFVEPQAFSLQMKRSKSGFWRVKQK